METFTPELAIDEGLKENLKKAKDISDKAESEFVNTRSRFMSKLKQIAVVGMVAFTVSCSGIPIESAQENASAQTSEVSLDYANSVVNEIYPGLKTSQLKLKEASFLETTISTTVLNYSDREVDIDRLTKLYSIIEQMTGEFSPIRFAEYRNSGQDLVLLPRRNPDIKKRIVLILPEDAPPIPGVSNPAGATWLNVHGDTTFTYLKVTTPQTVLFTTQETDFTDYTAVEACQQSVKFEPFKLVSKEPGDGDNVKITYRLIEDEHEIHQAQELGCNIIGHTIGARAANFSYDDYVGYIKRQTERFKMPDGVNHLLFTQAQYEAIPSVGLVLNK